MIYNTILEAVGNTPMIRLNRMPEEGSAEVLVKMEGLNVGGSIKTRTALNMIEQAEKEGLIDPAHTIIVEPTSGNQGIGLALVGAVKGYKTIIIMPDSVSEERRKLVRHYGAEVILIHDAGDIGACIDECLRTALRMRDENPRVFVPQQFENPNNTKTHKKYTALEIMAQVAGPIDGFCGGIGTGGTITGIGEVLKAQYPQIEIWAVEPENAAILAGGTVGTHLQMGIGDGIIRRRWKRPGAWPERKASWWASLRGPMWRQPSSWPRSSGRARQSSRCCRIRRRDIFPRRSLWSDGILQDCDR